MIGLSYQHIGHDPRNGTIALWSLDRDGTVHEDRKRFPEPNAAWLDWSHENCFREVKPMALGRVEIDRRAGSIHINDATVWRSEKQICKILDALDRAYPQTRWYFFGPGVSGATPSKLLSEAAGPAGAA